MFRSKRRFSLPLLAAVLIAAGSTVAPGQIGQPPVAAPMPPGPGHVQPPGATLPGGGVFGPYTPSWQLPGTTPLTAEGIRNRQLELLQQLEQQRLKQLEQQQKRQQGLLQPSVEVGGRLAVDAAMFSQSEANQQSYGDIENGIGITRARIYVRGEAFHVIEYKLSMAFDNWRSVIDDVRTVGQQTRFFRRRVQSTAFKDAYVGINELPFLGHLKIGRFKEPFSLSKMTSSRFTTFMERSPVTDAFSPGRGLGIMAFDWSSSENYTWALGLFRSVIDPDPPIRSNDGGGTAVTMRATWLPWYDEATEGRGLLHLGIGYSFRDTDDGIAEFSSPPESLLAIGALDPGVGAIGIAGMDLVNIVDTGNIDGATNWQLLGAEAAWVYGPLSVQAEYIGAFVNRTADADAGFQRAPNFHGCYAHISYFLTGEHRPYNRTAGKFARVVPFENFFRVRTEGGDVVTGMGAWEIAYRFSYVDMDFFNEDEAVPAERFKGGRSVNHTFGVNWYLNPYTRMMFNYVLANSTPKGDVDYSDLHVFQARAQIDF